MSLEYQMKNGQMYREFGHAAEEDQRYEKLTQEQRSHCKEVMYDFNQARPSDLQTRRQLLKNLLAEVSEDVYMESPVHFAYGCNTHIGRNFYSNFNMSIVDDCEVFIGDDVMFGPNVTLSVTGHPVWPEYRKMVAQFSLPIRIGNGVWIGANAVVLPGVTIGDHSVIGAGSVVSKDVPANVVACGVPCKVLREISEYDRAYYSKGLKVIDGWDK